MSKAISSLLLVLAISAISACSNEGDSSAVDAAPTTDSGFVFDKSESGANYVSMGDSAAAGPLIPMQRTNPASCMRSAVNYPSVLADTLAVARFQDMTCSAALTDHLFEAQGDNPPQLDALTSETTLVTLGPMGANDVGSSAVFNQCGLGGLGGLGPTCASFYPVTNGRDQFSPLLDEVAKKIGKGLAEIHRRSPKAKVYVVGYGLYFPKDGCFPTQPFSAEAANYIQGLHNRVNDVLRQQAELHGAQYLSTQGGDADQHTSCAVLFERWIVGLIPDSPASPFHPSALGMENFAAIAAESILLK